MHILIWTLILFKMCVCYHQSLLFNTPKDIRIAHLTKPKKFSVIVKDLRDSFALDYLYNDSLVCWTDHGLEQIDCLIFNGTYTGNRTTYAKHVVPKPEGLACDWLTRKLYWTDNESKRIEVVSLQTKHRKVLYWTELEMPRAVALDPLEGIMFWTDWSDPPKIEHGSMDGDPSSRRIIIKDDGIYWPNSLSVDVIQKKIYWVDGKIAFIEVVDYDGRNRRKLAEHVSDYPFALSFADDELFWTDWKTYTLYSVSYKTNNSSPQEIVHLAGTPIVDVKSYNASRQPYEWTPCEKNNGGCSHLCLLSFANPRKYSCACPTGIKLLDDKTCSDHVDEFILLVQRTEISKISLDTADHSSIKLPVGGVKHAMGIDYDPVDDFFYWTDMELRSVRRAKLDGSRQENVVTAEVIGPDGVAVDYIARNVYWSDMLASRIEVQRLDTAYRKVVVFQDVQKPRAVVVSPRHGWLFWSDWDEKRPKIERANLDGSSRTILVKRDIGWPNGLALDHEEKKLYWGDARTDKIEVIGMDGYGRRELLSDNLSHVFGLALLGDRIYWSDWHSRSLEMVNKISKRERTLILDSLVDVKGIKAVKWNASLGTNLCIHNNGNCSQFCFSKPANGYACSCQVEYELDVDQRTCVLPRTFVVLQCANKMIRLSTRNEFCPEEVMPITGIKSISAIDVSLSDKRLYWADNKMRTINRAFMNGTRFEKIVSGSIQSPEAIAVDWLSQNLYWADVGSRRIEVIRLNTLYRRTLFWNDLHEPRNLVLDPRQGYMFWSEWKEDLGSVTKAPMDGSSKRAIIDDVGRLNGLTIDYAQGYLYWTHSSLEHGKIEACDVNGQNRRLVVNEGHLKPYVVAQSFDYIFWTRWNDSTVIQANKYNGGDRRTLHVQVDPISDMRIADPSKQTGWNNCALNNGGCKHLCLVGPSLSLHSTDVKCVCPTHYIMKDDICHPPNKFLLFSQRNALHRLTINITDCPDAALPISGLKGINAIEYDSETKHVYWIEKNLSIRRCHENGSHCTTLVGGSRRDEDQYWHLYDIAVEPFNKLLFWSCSVSDTINVTRLNTSNVGSVFRSKNGEKPRSLAVHSEKGLLFWTDVSSTPCIVQSRLNGDRWTIINTDNRSVDSLSVDRSSNTLYYSIAGTIYAYSIVGQNKLRQFAVGTKKVFGVAVIQKFLYWIEEGSTTVERGQMNASGALSERVALVKMSKVTDLTAVDPVSASAYRTHPCSVTNNHGNCSHLCVPSLEGGSIAECVCPLSFKLSEDRKTCFSQPLCGPEHYICKSTSSECIPAKWKCDGHVDCSDGSDEESKLCFEPADQVSVIYSHENLLTGNDSNVGEPTNSNFDATSLFTSIALLTIFAAVLMAVAMYRFGKKCKHPSTREQDFAAMRPLAQGACPQIGGFNAKPMCLVLPMKNGVGSAGSYERSHVTESSSTSMVNCPLNPPPSPTTTTMHQDECDCMPYMISGPTPTPCSTDVCDESDATYQTDEFVTYRTSSRASYHRRTADVASKYRPSRLARHHRKNHAYWDDFDSAPPPTPRSWSNPPSPSLSPYAPPPTPINSPPLE